MAYTIAILTSHYAGGARVGGLMLNLPPGVGNLTNVHKEQNLYMHYSNLHPTMWDWDRGVPLKQAPGVALPVGQIPYLLAPRRYLGGMGLEMTGALLVYDFDIMRMHLPKCCSSHFNM